METTNAVSFTEQRKYLYLSVNDTAFVVLSLSEREIPDIAKEVLSLM